MKTPALLLNVSQLVRGPVRMKQINNEPFLIPLLPETTLALE